MNILVVEDNPHMRRMLVDMMRDEHASATVLEAADAASALSVCRLMSPELVLMDVGLPDGNGIQLTVAIKAFLPKTRVVMVSNRVEAVYREAARRAGASDFVVKDDIGARLLAAIRMDA